MQEKPNLIVSDTEAKKNRNEAKLVAALRTVYPYFSDQVAKKYLEGENFKILAWPLTSTELNNIVDTRHLHIVNVMTKALIPPEEDPFKILEFLN
jgi:antitoxin component HigA of HigAB toxin-antitoxin module